MHLTFLICQFILHCSERLHKGYRQHFSCFRSNCHTSLDFEYWPLHLILYPVSLIFNASTRDLMSIAMLRSVCHMIWWSYLSTVANCAFKYQSVTEWTVMESSASPLRDGGFSMPLARQIVLTDPTKDTIQAIAHIHITLPSRKVVGYIYDKSVASLMPRALWNLIT